jgi:glutamate racemase
LVLGCTHFAFLRDSIAAIAGANVTLVDPAQAVARELVRRLGDTVRPAVGGAAPYGSVRFLTSGDIAQARSVITHLWGGAVDVTGLPAAT